MATSRIDRTRELVTIESLAFMRPITIKFTARDLKPNARMFPTFDLVDVSLHCTPTHGPDAGIKGGRLIADEVGVLIGTFDVPGMSFTTGSKEFKLAETKDAGLLDLPGSTFGYAVANFTSNGKKEIYQETVTTTNTIEIEQIVRVEVPFVVEQNRGVGDPLAQSFFTYGIDGGCFITSIDLYFASKDDAVPVVVEIREMINGYPGPAMIHPNSRVSKHPSEVNTSLDSTAATNFKFPHPFYLEPDKDYAFVVLTNCSSYTIFTSTLSETSFETGNIIFEQPQLGSMFKSQNNMTWTAEQYDDIKFTMYQAEFDTSVEANLKFNVEVPATIIDLNCLSTTQDSNVIRAELTFDHSLQVGSKVQLAIDTNGVYNGIPGANLNGVFDVVNVITQRIFEFIIVPNATSTGKIETGGFVNHIYIDNGGSGYDPLNPPVVSLSAPLTGTTAIAVPVIEGGKIIALSLTNRGSGYTNEPSVSIVGSVGSGAAATAVIDMKLSMATNRAYQYVNPSLPNLKFQDTDIRARYKYTKGNYEGGNITSYSFGDEVDFDINNLNFLEQNAWLVSRANENALMSNQFSSELSVILTSNNSNLSPVISLETGNAIFYGNLINNQPKDDLTSTDSTGQVLTVEVTDGGTGYAAPPVVEFFNLYGNNGSGATAVANISGGVVTSVTVTNPGTGYYDAPLVRFVGASTTPAIAEATISSFNSELGANHGLARSRYITKINTMTTPSDAARVFVTAYSGNTSNFDVYIRTSLKVEGKNHSEQEWQMMTCDIERNASMRKGQFMEYEFYLNDIPKFDSYDLKIVLRSMNPVDVPIIQNYRAIMAA